MVASTRIGKVRIASSPPTVIRPGRPRNDTPTIKTANRKIAVSRRVMYRANQKLVRFCQVMTIEPAITITHIAAYKILVNASATPGNGCGMTRAKTRNKPIGVIEVIKPVVMMTALFNFRTPPLVDDFPEILAEEDRTWRRVRRRLAAVHRDVE